MNNILIKVNSSLLTFTIVKKKEDKDLNNTNIINTKELLFSIDYIKYNTDLVSSFLNTIVIKNNIDKIRVNNIELVTLVLDLINKMDNIKKMLISEDKTLNYDIFMKLLDNHSLEYLNCYDIPPYLLERLDINKKLKVDMRCEIFFMSKFMEDNKLYKYSDIYYKKTIVINKNFDTRELEEFKTFININNYLKEIHIKNYTNDLIYSIIAIFKENNLKDKIIVFYENNNIDIIVNSINYLKNIYKGFLENNNIDFKIVYSKEYKRKNFFKQLNFVTLKYICFILITCALIFSGLDYYKNYRDESKHKDINNQITNILNNLDYSEDSTPDIEYIDTVENESTTTENYQPSSYYTKYNQLFEELSKVNNDTIGWLTVNNTQIDYPIVQTTDNEFYLKKDYNKNQNTMGWLFMDYRNNIYNMSDNTIIYGHNIKAGLMFGTLRYTLNESWYTNPNNQIITFNTKVKNMKWRVFSVYRIPVTNDYLYANFANKNEYQQFLNTIRSRSVYDFGIDIGSDSHILTLSTCGYSSAQRVVVHAVLIEE